MKTQIYSVLLASALIVGCSEAEFKSSSKPLEKSVIKQMSREPNQAAQESEKIGETPSAANEMNSESQAAEEKTKQEEPKVVSFAANLNAPNALALDGVGDLYVSSWNDCIIKKINVKTNEATVIAGITGTCGNGAENIAATASELNGPASLVFDKAGDLYVAESKGHRIRKIDMKAGTIVTVAGSGSNVFNGEGPMLATSASLNWPTGVTLDNDGNLLIADQRHSRVRIVKDGQLSTFAGSGFSSSNNVNNPNPSTGDGLSKTQATFRAPAQVFVDAAGNTYVNDYLDFIVRKIDPSGKVGTIAGNRSKCEAPEMGCGDGGPALNATFTNPWGMIVAKSGVIYIPTAMDHRIRKLDTDGAISTVAGTGVSGSAGDNGPAKNAQFILPVAIAFDALENFYIADFQDNRIRYFKSK